MGRVMGRIKEGLPVGPPQQIAWLEGLIKVVLVSNLVDAVLTLVWLRAGLASEANLLLAPLALGHPVVFVGVKLALVSGGSWLLWRNRERPPAVVGIFAVFIAYYWIFTFHLQYASTLFSYWVWPEG